MKYKYVVLFYKAMKRRLENLESERHSLETTLDERRGTASSVQKDLADTKTKRERIGKQVYKVWTMVTTQLMYMALI